VVRDLANGEENIARATDESPRIVAHSFAASKLASERIRVDANQSETIRDARSSRAMCWVEVASMELAPYNLLTRFALQKVHSAIYAHFILDSVLAGNRVSLR